MFAVFDCLQGPLGFVTEVFLLLREAQNIPALSATERPVPAQNIVNLFFFTLLTCSGAVGVQAFSSIHMRTAILLYRMKVVILAYAFVRLVWHIHAHVHRELPTEGTKEEMDDGGDELTMYLVLSWIWEICLPAYTLYMAYSYYMEIDRGQRIGLMYPDMLDYLDPNAIPMEHYILPPSGQVVSTRGHCSECYQMPGSNAQQCAACAALVEQRQAEQQQRQPSSFHERFQGMELYECVVGQPVVQPAAADANDSIAAAAPEALESVVVDVPATPADDSTR